MTYIGDKHVSLEISIGNVPGYAPVNKFGRNFDIDTGTTPEDIWDIGGVQVPPTVAQTFTIASTSALDNGVTPNTGARKILVSYLPDWNTPEVQAEVTLNGTTNVVTTFTGVFCHRAKVTEVGTVNGRNVGDITITATTDGTPQARITADYGQTLMAIYGVPLGKCLHIENYYAIWTRSGGASNEANVLLLVKENADQATGPTNVKHAGGMFGAGNTVLDLPFRAIFSALGPAIIKVQCENVSANNTDISAGFNGYLIDV